MNKLFFTYIGASFASLFWDIAVVVDGVILGYYIYKQPDEDQQTLKYREKRRINFRIALVASNALAWYYAKPTYDLLYPLGGISGSLVRGVFMFFLFPCFFGTFCDYRDIIRYFTKGNSRFNSGIIDELVEGSHEAVLDYQRLFFSICGIVGTTILYNAKKYIFDK
ncbi:hypothetical protein DLAC_10309 [Tieghemostelium lacteum]|uniref:Transmembrane protein n=1 Tax=Tieghemostelium lacteum TaxID=361077 RepID=A0A151Z561_TIELA|nr:hypothetical protein DLAC_10309 [Tieghemostelium lacteum]|eukprot:KYQ89081.1 hypothetical protein DLAC_10309 [Tieghemostelium lacteum]